MVWDTVSWDSGLPSGFNVGPMSGQSGERAARRAAAEVVGAYHEQELGKLLEHVREALARCDAGEADASNCQMLWIGT